MSRSIGTLSWFSAVALSLTVMSVAACRDAVALAPPSKAFGRAAPIGRSISIWRWFNRPQAVANGHYGNYISDIDLAYLKKAGFTAIRLPVGTEFLFGDDAHYGVLRKDRLTILDAAIGRINAAGMVVVVDFHPRATVKKRLEQVPAFVTQTAAFWEQFARHFSATDPDKVMLELLNEPRYSRDDEAWNSTLHLLWKSARRGAPRHTLILSSANYGAVDRLSALRPVPDDNVIYTVHFYEPMKFTSQGARFLSGLRRLPWPTDTARCREAVAQNSADVMLPDGKGSARDMAKAYCAEGWNDAKLRQQVAVAGRWARTNHVPVWVGEFGVRAQNAPGPDRRAWLHAASQAFSAQGLLWSLWSFDDCFGLGLGKGVDCLGEPQSLSAKERFACETLSAIGMGQKVCFYTGKDNSLGKTLPNN